MNIDLIIFFGFLALNLALGLKYGANVKDIKDYALGGRNFSTATLVATITATCAGGGGFFNILSETYTEGLYYMIASMLGNFSLLVVAFVFIPRMERFLGGISVADTMGKLYGDQARMLTALAGMVRSIGAVAVQYKACGNIFAYFLDLPGYVAIILSGTVVTLYSAFGGIRAVTFTDVLQFLTFGFIMPVVGLLIFNASHISSADIINLFSTPKFNFTEIVNLNNPAFVEMIPLYLYFLITDFGPADYQRIMLGRNINQVKKAFIISTILLIAIESTIAWIPALVYAINPGIEPSKLLGYIIDTYTYPGLKGLLTVAITAMAMSTADSFINASSVLFAHDICKPLSLNLTGKKELWLSKRLSVNE